MMNKLTMAFLTAAVTLGSSAAMAVNGDNNGNANQTADAGAVSGGAEQTLAPNHVSNDRINEGSSNTVSGTKQHHKMNHHKQNSSQMHKNAQCKGGNCQDSNKKNSSRRRQKN